MISRIIGFPGPPLDDDAFGIATAASYLGIHIILSIGASWKTSFSVLEVTPPDVARQRSPTSRLELFEQIIGLLGRCCERGRLFDVTRRADDGVGVERFVTEVGTGDGDRGGQAEGAQQADKKTDEPNSSPSRGEHSCFPLGKLLNGSSTVAFSFQEGQTRQEPSPRYLDVSRPVC